MEFELEFEGFEFNANSFIAAPGLNEKKEVLAVLKHSPATVVGGNKPFIQKQQRQLKKFYKELKDEKKNILNGNFRNQLHSSTDNQISNLQIAFDIDDVSHEQKEESPILTLWRGLNQKKWFFIGGDLYLNLEIFTNEGQKKKEVYSHWNEWRPHSTLESFQDYIQLNMRTDNEAPSEFSYVIEYLQNMQINQAFQVSQMLKQYSLYVQKEFESCQKIKSFCEDHFESLQELLAENYNNSLKKAHQILKQVGQEYPFIYFIRKHNYRSLRMQVSAIGFNYILTEILCENKDNYIQTLHHNGFSEIFSNYTHYKLLMMNLLNQNEADIEIVTVDDILVPCKVLAYSYDLTTYTLTKDTSFTNSLRIYKFEIDDFQIKRIARIRKERPLNYQEIDKDFQYNFTCDQFLRQYYHYFAYQKNSKSIYQNTKQQLVYDQDKLSVENTQNKSPEYKNPQAFNNSQDTASSSEINGIDTQIILASEQDENQNEQNNFITQNIIKTSNTQINTLKNTSLVETQNQIQLQDTLKQLYQLNLTQFQNNNLSLVNNSNILLQQNDTSNLQQNNIQNINNNILNNNLPNSLNSQNTPYNIYNNINNISPDQFIQSQEQILQLSNTNQIPNSQLSLIPLAQLTNSNQVLRSNTENSNLNQQVNSSIQYGADFVQKEQQQQMQQFVNILNDYLELQQKKILNEQKELEQLQDLMTRLLNEQTINFQLYVQLKQILINYNLIGQIAPLTAFQNIQYIEQIQSRINILGQK